MVTIIKTYEFMGFFSSRVILSYFISMKHVICTISCFMVNSVVFIASSIEQLISLI